ncbi:MAG: cupin domain-containing protein [Betaproteobacteria bacterium]|nr:cupin domain-containing protein [Betaproteobacteria bacterium]
MKAFSLKNLLGGMSTTKFLRDYWQKEPLLVRQALPGFGGWLDRASLSDLACRDNAESRLLRVRKNQWQLDYGPFERKQLDRLPAKGWSLLVSGMNHLLPEGDRLLHSFDFLPQARLDDLMVSFAPPGGGVGPHFDSYDVFLIQGQGRRRWEISSQDNLELVEGAPTRILSNFVADRTWELEPGDMLYLPPRFPHNGVALTDCMTWSVGFRAPKAQEIATQFLIYLQDKLEMEGLYADPDLKTTRHSGRIPDELTAWAVEAIHNIRWDERDVADFLGRYISEPKAHVFFEPPERPLGKTSFAKAVVKKGIRLDPRSQVLYAHKSFYINGEEINTLPGTGKILRNLADSRQLPPGNLDDNVLFLLHSWYECGYITLAPS